MITLVENDIKVEEYLYIRNSVSWKKLSNSQAQKAIDNSLFFVKAIDENGKLVGMGRIVGDGSVICYIQDLVVVPEFQKSGIGSVILNKLIYYVKSIKEEGTTMMLCLMCAKGREPFYIKHNFIPRPTDGLGPGMIQYLE